MFKNAALSILLAAAPVSGVAQSYDNLARIELLPGWRTAEGDHIAALRVTLKPGWVTYWRAPGDAGIPPALQFEGDGAIEVITPRWPTPEVFGEDGVQSIGYQGGVTVPLAIALDDQAGDVRISGEITIGVCEEVCIPVTQRFSGLLPDSAGSDPDIAAALADQPITAAAAGVGPVTCQIAPISDGLQVTAVIPLPVRGSKDHVVIESPDPRVWVSEAAVTRNGQNLHATVDMVHPTGGAFALDRGAMRITVLGDGPAIDIRGCNAG